MADFETQDPQQLPTLSELPPAWADEVQRSVGYQFEPRGIVDRRVARSS